MKASTIVQIEQEKKRKAFFKAQKEAKSPQELVELTRKRFGKLTKTTLEHQLWVYEDTESPQVVDLFEQALEIA